MSVDVTTQPLYKSSADWILFNNAVSGLNGDLWTARSAEISLKSWHHVHSVNLDGVLLGCKYAIGLMKKHGGSIINTSSRSGVVGIAACLCSRAAVRNHTKTVALYAMNKV